MHNEEWPKLRRAIEGALHAVEVKEAGSFRIHTGSAERMAGTLVKHSKGSEHDHAKQIEADVHKAKRQIDIANAIPFLQNALSLVKSHAPDVPA